MRKKATEVNPGDIFMIPLFLLSDWDFEELLSRLSGSIG